MKKFFLIFLVTAPILQAKASISDYQLNGLIGYTLIDALTIEKWVDGDGKQGSAFEGCNYGRVIVFSNGKGLTCRNYSYSYSYRPTAYIFFRQGSIKMLVDGNSYDMR